MSDSKILAMHVERRAIVYARQSSLRQLVEHKESTARQYALKERAIALGWKPEMVKVIDDDLGQSGVSTEGRQGFQKLAEDVAHGRVGGIFALEVSRFARSSADWHRLLDLCSLADVIIADEQSVFNPKDYNDRLILGLKGTLSEAEQYWMRLRLEGGRIAKARRGEMPFTPAVGYEWHSVEMRFRFDPDEGVQKAIRLVFERFSLDGSAYAVTRYFAVHGLLIPSRGLAWRDVRWRKPTQAVILCILHNPIYAGAYAFGRRSECMGLVDGKIKKRTSKKLPQESWKVLIKNRHPAYISWDEFTMNQKRISDNASKRHNDDRRGAARNGHALLQGLALCGVCGRKMEVRYQGPNARVQYQCLTGMASSRATCWSVAGNAIDRAVEKIFLDAVVPSNIDLALSIAREVEKQTKSIDSGWRLRIERLEYESRLAERRYKATDPENRVVARTLEREWEEKLRELNDARNEQEEIYRREKIDLTKEEKKHILALSGDLKSVWHSPSTTHAERKNMLRIVIKDVSLTPVKDVQKKTCVRILWQSGAVSEFNVERRDRYTARRASRDTIELIHALFDRNLNDHEIASELNERNLPRLTKDAPWDVEAIRRVRYSQGMYRPSMVARRAPNQREDGLFSIHGVAEYLQVTQGVVRGWIDTGTLHPAAGGGTGHVHWFRLDLATVKRLQEKKEQRNQYDELIFRNLVSKE